MNKTLFLALLPTPCSLVALLCLMGNVWALDNVPYLDESGVEQTADGVTVINANGGKRTLNAGWYLVRGAFTNDSTIAISGTVHLILEDGSDLMVRGSSGNAGINVSEGNSLSIYAQSTGDSMGKLTATGNGSKNDRSPYCNSGAGIGGGFGNNGGVLFIGNDGKVYGCVELQEDLEIESGYTLIIPENATLTNKGKITPANGSTIIINGTVNGENKINGANAHPSLISKTSTSITLGGTADLLANTAQEIEYAISQTDDAPASGWQTEATFAGLAEKTDYWIFARSKENTHFAAGAVSAGLQVSTKPTPTIADLKFDIPTGHIYNGKAQGIGNVTGIAGIGTITIYYNGSSNKPANAGTYAVTVDIAESADFYLAEGIALGEYEILPSPTPILHQIATGSNLITPTHNGINLTAKTGITIAVYNLSGKLVNRQEYLAGSHSISFGHLPRGVYLIQARFGKGVSTAETLRLAVH